MSTTLQAIREKLKQNEQRGSGTGSSDNAIYPFWNLKEGGESVIRFLPDGNESNTFFWVERSQIKLPFAGIKGESESKDVMVQVPCMEMYNETCPILAEVRPWFKDPSLEEMGHKYWKKRSYLFQAFVIEDGLKETDSPENPIRRMIIGPQVFKLIRSALVDDELENLPTDYVHGIDFRLKKTQKGGFADYATSSWSRRERALKPAELEAIKTHGLYDLAGFLPKKPGANELKAIKEMFEASVNGDAYDAAAWSQYYKPFGMATSASVVESAESYTPPVKAAKVSEPEVETVAETVDEDATTTDTASTGDSRAQEILKMIRNRQK